MRRPWRGFSKAPKQHKRSASAQPKGPAVNPSSIELALLHWMSRPNSSECEESREGLAALESEIASHAAKDAFETLLAADVTGASYCAALGIPAADRSISFSIIGLQSPDRSPFGRCSA